MNHFEITFLFEYEHNVIRAVKLSIADCKGSYGPDLIHTFSGQKKFQRSKLLLIR